MKILMFSLLFIVALLTPDIAMGKVKTVASIITQVAKVEGVPANLLRAICWAESNHKSSAYNYNDGGIENSAFGACQVLYSTAVELGLKKNGSCLKDFRKPASRSAKKCSLFSVQVSATYAAKYLKLKLKKYPELEDATAAYNTGSKIICNTGWLHDITGKKIKSCNKGDLINRYYVRRVFKALVRGR